MKKVSLALATSLALFLGACGETTSSSEATSSGTLSSEALVNGVMSSGALSSEAASSSATLSSEAASSSATSSEAVSTGSKVSCDMPEDDMCIESSDISKEEETECTDDGGTLGTGCKSESEFNCTFEEDGVEGTVFGYGEEMKQAVIQLGGNEKFCEAFAEEL